MSRKEFTRLFTLLPDLKNQHEHSYIPSVLCRWSSPTQGSQFFVSWGSPEATHRPTGDCTAMPGRCGFRLPENLRGTIRARGRGAALWEAHKSGQGSKQGSDARSHFTGCKEDMDPHGEFALQSGVLSWALFLVITVDMFLGYPGKNCARSL